jgi:hypothetical protein
MALEFHHKIMHDWCHAVFEGGSPFAPKQRPLYQKSFDNSTKNAFYGILSVKSSGELWKGVNILSEDSELAFH